MNLRRTSGNTLDYWLAGAFARRHHPFADPAIATWSEILGREQAKLWMAARLSDDRGAERRA